MRQIDAHVPTAAHYDGTYLSTGRVYSLATQLDAALELGPRNVLEIGVGTGITAHALRRVGVDVTTFDVQADLAPDVLGDVRAIPLGDGQFDVSCCCQVLEHLPLNDLPVALSELRRVTRWRLVLSLPDLTRFVGASVTLPVLGARSFGWSLPVREPDAAWKAERLESMGHYWEIGMNGATSKGVARALRSAGFDVVRTFRVPEMRWHRFFIADIA
jgi:ubiquinone/menaquinone biosynthesis C-methylase UbiE